MEHLVLRLQQGVEPEHSFRQLFDRCYRLVVHFLAQRGCPRDLQEDLVQETFLRAFRAIHRFRGDARVETWLLAIAANTLRNHRAFHLARKRQASVTSLDGSPELSRRLTEPASPAAGQPPLGMDRREQRDQLVAALAQLPPQMRRCAQMHFLHEFSTREIATALRIAPGSVKVQLFRARRKLHHLLRPPSGNDEVAAPAPSQLLRRGGWQ